ARRLPRSARAWPPHSTGQVAARFTEHDAAVNRVSAALALSLAAWSPTIFADECGAAPASPLALAAAGQRLLACNRDIVAARLALQAARADLRVARQRPNPTLTLGASNLNPHA